MKLLLDENTSHRILKLIEEHFPDSTHVNLIDPSPRTDRAIWQFAKEHDFVIVTFDSDFVQLSALLKAPPHVVLLELKNPSYQDVAKALLDRREIIHAFVADRSKDASGVLAISA